MEGDAEFDATFVDVFKDLLVLELLVVLGVVDEAVEEEKPFIFWRVSRKI